MAQEQPKAAAEVQALLDQGRRAFLTGRSDQAAALYDQALARARELKDRKGEGDALRGQGNVYLKTSQRPKALELYQRSLAVARAIGDTQGEAIALSNMGVVHSDLGQSQKALELHNQALLLQRRIGNRLGEANTLNNIGNVYLNTNQPSRAMEFFRQALPLYRELGDTGGEASALTNLGIATMDLGRAAESLEIQEQALALHRRTGNREFEANTLAGIGNIHLETRQLQKAREVYEQALPLYRDLREKRGEASTLTNLGAVHQGLGQMRPARERYLQALPLHRESGDRHGEALVLGNLGFVEMRLGDLAQAEGHYAQAVALAEALRENMGALSESKAAYLGSRIGVYYAYLNVLLAREKTAAAFALAQKTKARSLLDLMASGRVDLDRGMTPQERAQERQLREKADALNQQMVKEGVQNEVGAKKRYAALQEELKRTESQLQTLTDMLYARHPGLAQKRVARTATFANVAKILPPGTVLLEYIVLAPDLLALFVVARGKVEAVPLPLSYPELVQQASALRAACADPRKEYRALAAQLHRLLLAPAAPLLAGVKRLIVCPDGALWDIPFQVLVDARGRFVAQSAEVVYAYSATGAVASLTAKANRRKPTGTLLALANPDFGSAKRFGDLDGVPGQRPIDSPSRPIDSPSRPIDTPSRPLDSPSRPLDTPSRAFDAVSRGGAIVSLPGTQREADALRRLFPGATVLTGKAAQESQAKQKVSQYKYLHFATHGVFNDASPMLSSLVLAQPSPGSGEDGFLTAREIFEMDLSAEMAVLSACNTARGVQRTGDGIIGLTWALFAAGCPTQVVSQWAVDDASTATLMQRFYSNLAGKRMGKGAALRQASLSLMNDPKRRHPYYWAPFVLMGDWK